MADMTAIEYKALMGDGDGGSMGGGAFLWIILIFLFFLAFSGNGLGNGGGSNMAQVERDVLTSSCDTQREVMENRYANALQFANMSAQQAACCCDLKTSIHAEGEQTRALIQAGTIQDLRDKLEQSQRENLANTLVSSNQVQTQTILSTLGQWYPLPGVNPCGIYNNPCGCGV
ncbi:MAG: hypothetical protein RSC96_04410 [Oscillospiraceae bacterium]